MASFFSSASTFAYSKPHHSNPGFQFNTLDCSRTGRPTFHVKCDSKESSSEKAEPPPRRTKLEIGSPVIVVEAPKMIKTAASVPCLRVNSGLVKPGDVGRIVSRKPKDVWAVRLSIGTYLIDGKYFKPLELNE